MIRAGACRSTTIRSRPIVRNVSSMASSCHSVKERLSAPWNNYPKREIADRIRAYHPGRPVVMNSDAIARHIPAIIDHHEHERDTWVAIASGYWGIPSVLASIIFGGLGIALGDVTMLEVTRGFVLYFALPINMLLFSPAIYHACRLKQFRQLQKVAQQELKDVYQKRYV